MNVRLIQAANSNGSAPATVLGDSSTSTWIKNRVDEVLGQAGIEVRFEPNVLRVNNDLVNYPGLLSVQTIRNLVPTNILAPEASTVNLIFSNELPPPNHGSRDAATYPAGVTIFLSNFGMISVGSRWLDPAYPGEQDNIALTIAHELGHVLGLNHVLSDINLMRDNLTFEITRKNEGYLIGSQINTMLTNGRPFLRSVQGALASDFNGDSRVDAADYTVWRDLRGSTTNLTADANFDRVVDSRDYAVFRSAYGYRGQAGAIPEPSGIGMTTLGLIATFSNRRSAARYSS